MSLIAMAFLWTGSQIPVYIFGKTTLLSYRWTDALMTTSGGIPPYIYADIGGVDRWIWFVLAYLIALAGICPFVGSLSDLLGRRYVALMGSLLILIGVIVSSTSHKMNTFIGKLEIAFPLLIKFLFFRVYGQRLLRPPKTFLAELSLSLQPDNTRTPFLLQL
jgi:MFS family permease